VADAAAQAANVSRPTAWLLNRALPGRWLRAEFVGKLAGTRNHRRDRMPVPWWVGLAFTAN